MQDGELALGRERQQILLPDGLLRRDARQPPAEAGRRRPRPPQSAESLDG
jgi:hypothetical protein